MASTKRTTSELSTSTTMSPCEATAELCHLMNEYTRKKVASKHEPCPALIQMILYRLNVSSCMTNCHTWAFKGCLLLCKRLPMTFSGAVLTTL